MWRKRMVIDEVHVMSLNVVSLKELCMKYKLTTKGMKANLRKRILEHLANEKEKSKSVVLPTKQGKWNAASGTTRKTVDDVATMRTAYKGEMRKMDKTTVLTNSKTLAFKKQTPVLKKVQARRNIQAAKK